MPQVPRRSKMSSKVGRGALSICTLCCSGNKITKRQS